MGFNRLFAALAVTGALSMLAISACSDDEDKTSSDHGGEDAGGNAGKGGRNDDAKGGTGGTATASTAKGGTAGTPNATTPGSDPNGIAGGAGVAGSGSTPTNNTLDDLIGAICNWEFKCCDAGEVRWQLGPVTNTALACKEKFVYLLRKDTAAASPYPSVETRPSGNSPAINGLLIQLGYEVDMAKVSENPAGIAACVAQWNTKSCNPVPTPKPTEAHCTTTSVGQVDPCELTKLVTPKLGPGDICNVDLTQSAYNDTECKPGTTCLAPTDPDNPNKSYATCVTRGVADAPCTFDKDCDYNFYCSLTTGKCTEKGSAGAVCSFKTPNAPKPEALSAPCKPGLSCNPISLKCIEDCKADYVCNSTAHEAGNDLACPSGTSCIPITLGNDSTSFKVCKAVSAATGRCNTLEDCASGLYCSENGTCIPRLGESAACSTSVPGNCAANTYCTAGGICASYIPLNKPCEQAASTIANVVCDPATTIGCVFSWDAVNSESKHLCSNALLANAQRCDADQDCQSGRCEFDAVSPKFKTCIAGAAAGEPCDAGATVDELTSTDGRTRCGPGLICDPVTTTCVAQSGPGGSCANESGVAVPDLCKNSSCNDTQWTPIDSSYTMCTDAAVAPFDGGTGVICDGQ